MDLLEHPLEAVAFRLYSLPIPEAAASAATGAAAAWTCLAAVLAAAAAAGIWRLRSSTTGAAVSVSAKKLLQLDPSCAAVDVASSPEPSRTSSQRSPAEPAAASSPKERYTAYFRDAGCVGCCDVGSDENDAEEEDDDDAEDRDRDRDVFVSSDPFGWGEVVRSLTLPRSPTARPYRGRSPTATALGGGSVVQLWDQGAGGGGLTPTAASPRLRGRVVFGGAVSAF